MIPGRVIDLHCHLLPGIDDGPGDVAATVALARAFVAEGITTVAATPHVHPDFPNTGATIAAARAVATGALAAAGITLRVVRGAELDLLHVGELPADALAGLQLGDSGTLLIECPFAPAAPFFAERVARVREAGFRVLLAHPERSPAFLREQGLLERLVAGGAMASLTATSLSGRFGRTARRYAEWALEAGLVHDVATDAHDTVRRPPILRAPLEASGHGWAATWLTEEAPAAILAGAPLPARPARPRRRWPSLRRGASGAG
jgi:protein-tyrosine phosphatase